ncbi:hypothetical protein LCI18_008616 [Fusarium solani-melongenae]|uniref:Uncharacterized protein n=1 Tax=Fusarium solani subsp. cucurbitae TaxID=2747967 RepID=A0ACD3Z965_FUSSC|nr:hypothetical protein LCI18_008616 [Fusarium solani-melongenae]
MSSSDENDGVVQNLLDAVWTTLNRPGLAVFAIGGDVQKPDSPSETTSSLAIRWDRDDQGQCRKLLLPVGDDPASKESFGMILEDCQPATFGVGSKEVLDEEYRKAGKMDDTAFSTSFNPYEHGIMDTINQVLAQGAHREGLGVRAEMYKLNVYSGPSGKFKAHVDTPRSDRQMGSLVVCLPVAHKGGELVVRHRGNQVKFDWGPKTADTIQWGAFFSDCEHEVLQVTEGHRMTLTYNLFWTSYGPASMADNLKALNQESLHFYSALQKLFDYEHFLTDGLVGFTCAHAYPHTSNSSMKNLHHMLKGIDMVVYQALKRLLGSACVTAVLDDTEYNENRQERMMEYSDDEEDNYNCVSTSLQPVLTCEDYDDQEPPDPGAITDFGPGPAFPRRAVTWLNHEPNSRTASELTVAFITYGNSPGIDAYYSTAVILAKATAFGEK